MLVLLSFVMVLVATVLLVLGLLVSDGINLIYVSIGMSAVAAVLLVIAVRMSKPSGVAAAGPAPLEPEAEPERELVGVGAASAGAGAASTPAPAAVSASDDWLASGDEWGSSGDAEFPIADYDDLTVDEVLGLLPQLYSDELDVVEARERRGLNRTPVIDRLAELRRTGTDADRSTEDEAAESDGGWERGGAGPIAGYDGLAVSEIIGALGGLNDAELAEVRNQESAGKNRRTIVAAIDRRLGGAPAPRRAAPRAAAAKKAPAKKAAARKAAPARKAAAPARKAAAPARKAAAAARKAPAKKAAAAPARKAAPAKKAPAKKAAAPAKKAAKKR